MWFGSYSSLLYFWNRKISSQFLPHGNFLFVGCTIMDEWRHKNIFDSTELKNYFKFFFQLNLMLLHLVQSRLIYVQAYQPLETILVVAMIAQQMSKLPILQTLTRLYTIFHQLKHVTQDIVTQQHLNRVALMNHLSLVVNLVK